MWIDVLISFVFIAAFVLFAVVLIGVYLLFNPELREYIKSEDEL